MDKSMCTVMQKHTYSILPKYTNLQMKAQAYTKLHTINDTSHKDHALT